MKMKNRFISIFISVIMLMQMAAFNVFAQSLEAHWGQDFPDEEWSFGVGEAVFWQRADITNFEFKLYKDNEEVYSNRIEEGSWGDETEGEWYWESIFLPKFADYGTGAYHFTVSSLTGDGFDIDEAAIIETATSGIFNYTKPSTKVSVPNIVSNKDGILDWEKTDDNTYAYIYDREVHYGNGVVYDPDYEEVYCSDDYQSEYDIEDLKSVLEYMDKNYDGKYPIENAQVKIRVRAMPADITEYNPSDYTEWYTIDYQFESDDTNDDTTEEEKPDRTVVTDSYYNAAKVVYDLDINPRIYANYSNTVTRADFAEVVAKIMGLEEMAQALKDTVYFSDIEKGTMLNGYANAMYTRGLMSGYEDGTFLPDAQMMYQDIIKILVTALGYEPMAQSKNGYPTGYLYVASLYGISKGVTLAGDSTVTNEQLSQLVYNSINTGMMKQTSFGYNAAYEVTEETLLYKYMNKSKFFGDVKFIDNTTAELSGIIYNKDYIGGTKVESKTVTIKDSEILDYEKTSMELYLDGDTILSGFEYEGVIIVINGGELKTTSRVVPVEIYSYGGKYTKYRIGSSGEYKDISGETIYYLLGTSNGTHTVNVYAANDDITQTSSKKVKISFTNKHKVTFMINGEVYSTKEIACGSEVTAPTVSMSGYTFNGWLDKPLAMPDKDIVVHGTAVKNVTYTGKFTQNGEPAWVDIDAGTWMGASNSQTGEFSFTRAQGEALIKITLSGVTKTIKVNGTEDTVDLGTIEFNSIDEVVETSLGTIMSANFKDAVLTEDDLEYAKTEGNGVLAKLKINSVYTSLQSTAMKNVLETSYPDYAMCKYYDITLSKQRSGTQTTTETVTETDELVMVKIATQSADLGKEDYVVLREHNGAVDALTKTPNENGEYIEVSQDAITIYAKKFSHYCVIGKEYVGYSAEVVWTEFETVNINVTIPQTPVDNAMMYVAFYDADNVLTEVKALTEFTEVNTFDVSNTTRKIKAFIWDGLKPLS